MLGNISTATASRPQIAVVGYGSQGRAHALNLRDSGYDLVIGLRAGGPSEQLAKADNFTVHTPAAAVANADLIAVLTPDMVQPQLWSEIIEPNIRPGACLLFAHGFNIHYQHIVPRADVDVILVAPKGPGALVRKEYRQDRCVPCFYAVHQDVSGTAEELAVSYAAGLGCARANLIKTSFREETETELFGGQAVLCGGATKLVLAGWETLVEAGYQPEIAYYECLHELKRTVDLLYEGGLSHMHQFISETAQYGALTQGPVVIDKQVKAQMRKILTEIRNGSFAREWIAEYACGNAYCKTLKQAELRHPIEEVGRALRAALTGLNSV